MMLGCARESAVERATREGVLLLGNGPEPQTLDPHISTGIPELNIHMALFEGLVSAEPGTLNPVPGAAMRWDVSADGLEYRFFLNQGLKWSNGYPLTAQDFAFAYERILIQTSLPPMRPLLFILSGARDFNRGDHADFSRVGVVVEDPYTLLLRLENPVPFFLNLLAHPAWYPVPKEVILRHNEQRSRDGHWTKPGNHVSNGPFRLKRWLPNEVIEVERNPHYRNADTVKLSGIRFFPIADVAAEERAFLAGQLHITSALPAGRVPHHQKRNPQFLRLDPYLGTYYILPNHNHPALADRRVRQALSMALNRSDLTQHLLRAGQRPAFSFTPDTLPDYQPPAILEENASQARELLAAAGYPEGRNFPELTFMFNTSESHRLIAEYLQETWRRELGIRVQLQNQEWRAYLQNRASGRFELARAAWIGDYQDAHSFLAMWMTHSGNNFSGWSNTEFDSLIVQSEQTRDSVLRTKLLQQAESLLLEEQVVIPLYFYATAYLKRPEVVGLEPSLLRWYPFASLSLKTEAHP
ncbi:MAG: peptide ABC transporter substrate-binding protein [Verrucomicrobia bacterium]|nr:peptide ABC transporter substrate-binding protein [Verrucomicrobiota bacterium]